MDQMDGRLQVVFPADAGGMEFTGERYVPGIRGQIQIEHLHRYALAATWALGRDVLDIACGEGYGASALARSARSVLGVDIDGATLDHARGRYHWSNLRFMQGTILSIPADDASFDLVVCYETLEHVAEHEKVIRELRRVLRDDGLLLISTPNRDAEDGAWHEENPFHAKELSEIEFHSLLGANFKNVAMLEQRFIHGSLVASIAVQGSTVQLINSDNLADFTISDNGIGKHYFLAVASDGGLPTNIPNVSCFDGVADLKKMTDDLVYSVNAMHTLERQVSALEEELRQTRIQGKLQSIQIEFLRKKLLAKSNGS